MIVITITYSEIVKGGGGRDIIRVEMELIVNIMSLVVVVVLQV